MNSLHTVRADLRQLGYERGKVNVSGSAGGMRLDQTLVALGLVQSRARAQDLIKRGFVRVGGVVCDKAALDVKGAPVIEIAAEAPAYVSRGAEKLIAALNHFDLDVNGAVALDIGASTGGFTEVLLERGARRVYAVDVGSGQLHARLRDDARVVMLENCDARALSCELVPEDVDAIVVDVSFISVMKVLGFVLPFARPGCWLVVLVKPQFEVGRDNVGSGGVVRDEAVRLGALQAVGDWIAGQDGWTILGDMPSPILGGSGNSEYLIGARRDV